MIRLLIYALGLALVAVLAFAIGRFTSPPPTFSTGPQIGGTDDLDVAFEDFIRAQRETLELFRSSDFFGDDQERAEAYRGLLYALVGSIKTGALMDPAHPRFMRAVDWTSKSGLDNPDNDYFITLLDDDSEYRITGNRGSTANLIFQVVIGEPGVRGAGTSTNVSMLDARDMQIDEEGNFEIFVGRGDPGPEKNWLPLTDGAKTLLVRATHSDWKDQRSGPLRIERIGFEGLHREELGTAEMARRLRDVAVSLFDRNATWLEYATRAFTLLPRNAISKTRPTRGGLVGQYSAFGSFELEDDEALILTSVPTEATYQGIELGNLWFVSLDYETRTSSMTPAQSYLGADGIYRYVISARDPGIENWLDTEGHPRGLVFMRWQGLAEEPGEDQQPTMRKVSFDRLADELPADTPAFNATKRRQQIRERRQQVQERFES